MSLDVYLTCEHCDNEVYNANITHNLTKMASEVGLYQPLWRPEELNITRAEQLIAPLEKGIETLKDNPEYYKTFNPDNGWGTYENLLEFITDYLEACRKHPSTKVSTWR